MATQTIPSMPSAPPPPPPPDEAHTVEQSSVQHSTAALELAAEKALVPVKQENESLTLNPTMARLPVELDVTIPVRKFRVRNLLTLEPGQVIETEWVNGEDMPLTAGEVQLAWTEFEVVEQLLAVRVTRLV